MKFFFVTPKTAEKSAPEPYWIPLGFASIGAVLRQAGHEVCIFDRYVRQGDFGLDRPALNRAMLAELKNFAPDVVGLSTVSPLIHDTVECAGLIRERFNGLLLAGGHHATALPALTLERNLSLDAVVEGEGELSLLQIAEGLELSAVPGVWSRGGAGPEKRTPCRRITDLDSLPYPDLSMLDVDFYRRPNVRVIRGRYVSGLCLLSSRGCTRACRFCTEPLTYGKGIRFHSAEYVADLAEKTVRDYDLAGVYFLDNDFLADEERVHAICDRFIAKGLHRSMMWGIQGRTDRVSVDMARHLSLAGCVFLEFGIEFSSQDQLDRMNKGTTVETNEIALRICQEAGIHVHASMITGTEGETLRELEQKLDWLKRVKPDTFAWSLMALYPGTDLYREHGRDFFAKSPWDEANIVRFFETDHLSSLNPVHRADWMKRQYEPYCRSHHRLYRLRTNQGCRRVRFLWDVLKRHIHDLSGRIKFMGPNGR